MGCGFWSSTEGSIVRVRSQKCDFVCLSEGSSHESLRFSDDADDIDDQATPDLESKGNGEFALWSWVSTYVSDRRVDWTKPEEDESVSWHRLSFLTDGVFEEDVSSFVVGDVVVTKEALHSIDSELDVHVPISVGGLVEAVDAYGNPSVCFPSVENLAGDCCCISKDMCCVLRT